MKKKKIPWTQVLSSLFMMLVGGICGIVMVEYLDQAQFITADSALGEDLFQLAIMILALILAAMVQTMVHEAGHLVFGLLSGYQFSSFRIGSYMWKKEDGKIRLKRFALAGTGGQCLMAPPDLIDGKCPVVLYNLGGSIMNLIVSAISILLYFILKNIPYLPAFLLMVAILGFAFALTNGIPMRMGMVDNDGYNAMSLGKNPSALRAFWIQLKANEQVAKGIRLKDMPDEWFVVPSEEDMKNSLISVIGVFACNRMMDEHRFEDANHLMEQMLSKDNTIVGLHKCLLVCDRMYCEMIGQQRREIVDAMLHKEQKQFMKAMKNYPSIIRTEYLYALLFEKDGRKSEKIKKQFEKMAKSYPYPSDIQAERELMEIGEQTMYRKTSCDDKTEETKE